MTVLRSMLDKKSISSIYLFKFYHLFVPKETFEKILTQNRYISEWTLLLKCIFVFDFDTCFKVVTKIQEYKYKIYKIVTILYFYGT